MRTSRLALVLGATLLAACPRPGIKPGIDQDSHAALTIPPGPQSLATVRELERKADSGDANAAWLRAHYLLDLFDDARYRDSDSSRTLLWAALDGDVAETAGTAETASRGVAATDRAAAALIGEVEEVLALDRLHRSASSARVILEFDRSARLPRTDLGVRMLELKAAGTVDSLAGNVGLRLAGYCLRALEDATTGPTQARARALSYCLYPLYEADPEPYFATAARRPPLPRWQDLVNGTSNLLKGAIPRSDRLVPTLQAVHARLDKLRTSRAQELPLELDPTPLALPRADHAEPYDWTPLAPDSGSVGKLTGPLEGDGRSIVALPLPGNASRADFDAARELARAAGASAIDLLVSMRQTLEIPAGDYWAQRGDSATIERVGAVRIALSTNAGGDQTPTLGPRHSFWDPRRAQLGLHLRLEPNRWLLTSPAGELVSIKPRAPKGDPRTELRVALERARNAYPEQAALVIVIAPNTLYTDLVRAATAAARDDRGRVLVPFLALGEQLPAQTSTDLARRIERRWQAKVRVQPDRLTRAAAPLRGCYQSLLESHPTLALRVTLSEASAEASLAGPAADQARDCVSSILGPAMREAGLDRAVVDLAPR